MAKIQVNKYANYVNFQPEWSRYPRNMVFEVTNIWNRVNTDQNSVAIDF